MGLGQQDNFAIERILALYNIVMTTGGIPLIYLGDEVGMLNDLGYVNDEAKAADSRWVHRVAKNPLLYKEAQADKNSATAKLFNGLKHLITLRKKTKALAGGLLKTINTRNASVIAYSRVVEDESVLVIANFSENLSELT